MGITFYVFTLYKQPIMDFTFKWKNTSVDANNSLGLNKIIHDVYANDQVKYELLDTSKLLDNNVDPNNLVNLEDKKIRKKPKANPVVVTPPSEPVKINIFKQKW